MIRFLVRIALLGIAGLVCYNYFFGKADEKAQSQRIFQGVGSVFTEVRGLLRSEHDKGTFDKALTKMDDVLQKLKTHADNTNDPNLKQQVVTLENRKAQIQENANAQQAANDNKGIVGNVHDKAQNTEGVAHDIESLTNDIQSLVKRVAPGQ